MDEEKPSEVGWVIPGSMMRGLIRGLHTKGATMNRGLYPAPDDEEPPVGESQTAASLPRADAPQPSAAAMEAADKLLDRIMGLGEGVMLDLPWEMIQDMNKHTVARALDAFTAARIAEAKAQGAAEERARIVAELNKMQQRAYEQEAKWRQHFHDGGTDDYEETQPSLAHWLIVKGALTDCYIVVKGGDA